MKKRMIWILGLAIPVLVLAAVLLTVFFTKKGPDRQFQSFLEQNGYTKVGDALQKQTVMENGALTETYTERYRLKEYSFTASFVRTEGEDQTVLEYVYRYKDDTATVYQYDSAESFASGAADAVYVLNREGFVECARGDGLADPEELYANILRLKALFESQLQEAGLTRQDLL